MLEAVLLLCFIMGLQNAIVTKISRAEIRTTHMTGVITVPIALLLMGVAAPSLYLDVRAFVQRPVWR